MAIDSHRHFWHYTPEEFGWVASDALKRDFLPSDCSGMDDCVAVEARQSIEETKWLLSLAREHSFIRAVVGWLPIAADDFSEYLDMFSGEKALAALRHVIQDEPDDGFILRKDFMRGARALLARGYAYDILVFERHLPNVVKFVDAMPDDARLVLDHMGKPHSLEPWRTRMKELARRENLYCKISGLVTETGKDNLSPYLEIALETFGPERTMFGSDWPVVTADMEYREWKSRVEAAAAGEAEKILELNARKFYGI